MKLVVFGLVLALLDPVSSSFTRTMFKAVDGVPEERRLAGAPTLPGHPAFVRPQVLAPRTTRLQKLVAFVRPRLDKGTPGGARFLRRNRPAPRRTRINLDNRQLQNGLQTVSIQTQSSLDKVVESSIKNSHDQKPQIIIINQPVPIGTEGDLHPLSTYDLDRGNYISGPYPPTEVVLKGPMTAYEIDGMISLLNSISNLYTSFYDMLPADEPTLNPSDKSLNVFEFYGKVRAFINGFIAIRPKLQKDLNFAVNRLITLRVSQDAMLKFYGFYSGFALLKKRTMVYEQRDPMFAAYAQSVRSAVESHNQFVNAALSKAFTLQKLSRFFDNEIMQLKNRSTNDNVLFVVDKFNDVLMFVVHVLEIRGEMLGNLASLEKDLIWAKGLRRNFENLLTQIDQRVTVDQNTDTASLMSNRTQAVFKGARVGTIVSVALVVGMWFN